MIRPLRVEDAQRIAGIDLAARRADVLPAMGCVFLTTLYSTLLSRPGVFGLLAEDDRQPNGFLIGCLDTGRAMRETIHRAWLPLTVYTLGSCLKRPAQLLRVMDAVRYPRKSAVAGPELLVLSVAPACQRRGIGTQLLQAFHDALRVQGFSRYHVTVNATNTSANLFYQHHRFTLRTQLQMYRQLWNLYERLLP